MLGFIIAGIITLAFTVQYRKYSEAVETNKTGTIIPELDKHPLFVKLRDNVLNYGPDSNIMSETYFDFSNYNETSAGPNVNVNRRTKFADGRIVEDKMLIINSNGMVNNGEYEIKMPNDTTILRKSTNTIVAKLDKKLKIKRGVWSMIVGGAVETQ